MRPGPGRALCVLLGLLFVVGAACAEESAPWIVGSEHLRVLYWPQHDDLARLARETGEQTLTRLRRLLDVQPQERIDVHIVRSQAEFDRLTGSRGSTWIVGQALVGQGRVVVKPVGPQRLPGLLAHELTHVMLDLGMGAAGRNLPRWLHEGVAQYAAGEWARADAQIIAHAALGGELLALDELDPAFEGKQEQVSLAYAQSYTLVVYLSSLRPALGVAPLLDEIKQGQDVRTALARAYGKPVAQIERDWLDNIRTAYLVEALPLSSEVILGALFVLAFAVAVVFVRRRSRRIRRRMEEEERMRRLMGQVRLIGNEDDPPDGWPGAPVQ